MRGHGKTPDPEQEQKRLAELRRARQLRAEGYREQALKVLPHVCASCGREFSGRRLRELTVHHRDHNYKNNPPDGKNWELLCLYCHDYEHERHVAAPGPPPVANDQPGPPIFQPFAGLDALLGLQEPADDDQAPEDAAAGDAGPGKS